MENEQLIDFSINKNSLIEIENIKSNCLVGNESELDDCFLTICIPTYNRPILLKESIESALNQVTTVSYKIIIVDNNDDPNDNVVKNLVESFSDKKLFYFKNQKNLGMAGNFNRCGQLVKSKYFAYVHDDDLLLPNYVNTVYSVVKKFKRFGLYCFSYNVTGTPWYVEESSQQTKNLRYKINNLLKKIRKYKRIKFIDSFLGGNVFGPPSCGVVFNTDNFLESGGFNQDYFPSLDWAFFLYFSQKYKAIKTFNIVSTYRWCENESLKTETQRKFLEQRCLFEKSIIKMDRKSRFVYTILRNDYKIKWADASSSNDIGKYSKLYKFLYLLMDIKLGN